jgi:tetratricopeptide (TPR) repeat protein
MKKITSGIFWLLAIATMKLHAQDAKAMQESARDFIKQGDYSNAVMLLNKAHDMEPNNVAISKDLAMAYYQKADYTKMQGVIKPLLEKDDAEADIYQLAGIMYRANNDTKEAEKVYKRALKSYPDNGALLSDYGELLWNKQDNVSIKYWEHGIQVDPSYTGNYYNACKYYYVTKDKAWSLIYGEMFVNMESYTRRTVEIKGVLLDGYKKLFTDADIMKGQDTKNAFATAFLTAMNKQADVAKKGITAETLTMIRTRFSLEWFDKYAAKFPFKLFDYQKQLLREGNFTAYNQWLFGSAQNIVAFESWKNNHAAEYKQFTDAQGSRMFKLPTGQYYQTNNK